MGFVQGSIMRLHGSTDNGRHMMRALLHSQSAVTRPYLHDRISSHMSGTV